MVCLYKGKKKGKLMLKEDTECNVSGYIIQYCIQQNLFCVERRYNTISQCQLSWELK